MILIADSGGTKVEWCVISHHGVEARFNTPGMNAMMLSSDEMADRVKSEVAERINKYVPEIKKVYFYGAGCVSPAVCGSVRDAIAQSISDAEIYVYTDLLGTARALCGHAPGIACILGTGSNSCYFDGEAIVDNVSALGYILGDEGGGAYLGKMLVSDVLKRQLPADIREKFLKEYDLDANKVIQRVYREPYPQKFLASLSPFLKANIEHPAIHKLVFDAFRTFFIRNIRVYEKQLPVNFNGSIAYYYSDVLNEAAESCGFKIGKIITAPMDELIKYHMEECC